MEDNRKEAPPSKHRQAVQPLPLRTAEAGASGPLEPLPDSAYPKDAKPLPLAVNDTSEYPD